MFTYTPGNPNLKSFTITESTSKAIWSQLNSKNIIDDFGVLLLSPNSTELTSAINGLSGLNEFQKERVLSILNQHPELSYHSYIKKAFKKHLIHQTHCLVRAFILLMGFHQKTNGLTKKS